MNATTEPARLDLSSAMARGLVTTIQTAEFQTWISAMAGLRNLTAGHAGAEQVAAVCRIYARHGMTATERQWSRLQSAYWISTDGHGRLVPSRLALITGY